MKICVICDGYPSKNRQEFVFVQQLCIELTKQGHTIYVVAPESITKRILRGLSGLPYLRNEKVGDHEITIYTPKYISAGRHSAKFKLIRRSRINAISRVIKAIGKDIDIIYGHFWHNGYDAYEVAKKLNIPIFVASGESEISQSCESKKEKDFCKYVSGVICVSTKNYEESKEKGLTTGTNCVVIPNAVDSKVFYKMDKNECRAKLGIDMNSFIVSFVGGMIERKGPNRVATAISNLKNENIKSFFIGSGRDGELIELNCEGILHYGPVAHENIPIYLNASDIFVLPTLHEGCCNAIVEAMSCGLPIISSDLKFNYDLLDDSNAILIDPNSIDEICQAIGLLHNNKSLIEKMSKNSLEKARELTIERRAKKIANFIQGRIG